MDNKPPFTVDKLSSYDPIDGSWSEEIYVKLHVSARTSGLMGELGPDLWHTLCCLATFMDVNGDCYPSVEQVGEALKIERQAASKRLKTLCDFRLHGRPIVRRTKKRHNGGHFANYRYTILPVSQLSIFDGKIEPPCTLDSTPPCTVDNTPPCTLDSTLTRTRTNKNQKELDKHTSDSNESLSTSKEISKYNAVDMIGYFVSKYKDKYGVDYVPNYSADGRQIKTKLLKAYGPEQLVKVIDATFVYYDQKWSTPQYPRPTIGALASWLANKVAAYVEDKPPQPSKPSTVGTLDYDKLLRDGK